MKQNAWEWDEHDLLDLIALGVQESLELDYKQCDALQKTDNRKSEISKDVSAFANSAGGTLVYGMIENGHVPTALDVGYDANDISKEWLEQVINSRIQRRIDGVRVNQVKLSTAAPGRVAYVVSIPQSIRAPHQASDRRFYKRFNFECVPMEEYEIRDVARRAVGPNLVFSFLFNHDQTVAQLTNLGDRSGSVFLNPQVTNEGPAPAEYVTIKMMIDSRVRIERCPVAWKDCHAEVLGKERHVHEFRINWNGHGDGNVPLLEGVTTCVSAGPLSIYFQQTPSEREVEYILSAELRADRMETKRFAFCLRFDAGFSRADIRPLDVQV